MDENARSGLKGRDEILQDLDAVLIRPIVEDRAKEVDICGYWLLLEEIAVEVSVCPITSMLTYCAMNSTRPRSASGSLDSPSATTSGRSCT